VPAMYLANSAPTLSRRFSRIVCKSGIATSLLPPSIWSDSPRTWNVRLVARPFLHNFARRQLPVHRG
jgi:hypothetical protein